MRKAEDGEPQNGGDVTSWKRLDYTLTSSNNYFDPLTLTVPDARSPFDLLSPVILYALHQLHASTARTPLANGCKRPLSRPCTPLGNARQGWSQACSLRASHTPFKRGTGSIEPIALVKQVPRDVGRRTVAYCIGANVPIGRGEGCSPRVAAA
jgi:hypothetical protein